MKKIIAITLLLAAGLAFSQDNSKLFNQEKDRILDQRVAGKLTILETAIEIEEAGRAYFPTDTLLHAYNASITTYSKRLEVGDITEDRYKELFIQRTARFDEAISARKGEDESARSRQEQAMRDSDASARQSQGIGNFLSGMANSLNRQYPRPITCSSTAMPGVMTTNCQ